MCSSVCLISLVFHLPISQSLCLKEAQYISTMCAHVRQQTPQGSLPYNSLLWYAILPLGQSQHHYPAHTVSASHYWYQNLWNSRRTSGLSHALSSLTDKLPLHQCHICTSYPDLHRVHCFHEDKYGLQPNTIAHTYLSSAHYLFIWPHLLSSIQSTHSKYLSIYLTPCNRLAVCPGCTPPLARYQLGQALEPLRPLTNKQYR